MGFGAWAGVENPNEGRRWLPRWWWLSFFVCLLVGALAPCQSLQAPTHLRFLLVVLVLPWLESSTPSLSYISEVGWCSVFIHPLANPCLCSNNCLPLLCQAAFCPPARPPTHPWVETVVPGGGGGVGETPAWCVPVAGCVAPMSLRVVGSRGFLRPCRRVPPPPVP